ncbi:MAG TPA: hypothetical protein VGF00_08350, partial [Acidimicrobiia bacterium]
MAVLARSSNDAGSGSAAAALAHSAKVDRSGSGSGSAVAALAHSAKVDGSGSAVADLAHDDDHREPGSPVTPEP